MSLPTKLVNFLLIGLVVALSGCAQAATDYTNFARLPDKQKSKIVWDLFDQNEWGKPEQKPICRDLLATQGKYCGMNDSSFTDSALEATRKQGWTEFRGLVEAIYKKPVSIWNYQSAFECLRSLDGKQVPEDIKAAAETIRESGFYQSRLTPAQVSQAQDRLLLEPDREAAMVYALYVAAWHAGKGGNNSGQKCAADILKVLDPALVHSTLKAMHENFDEMGRSELDWVIGYLQIKLD